MTLTVDETAAIITGKPFLLSKSYEIIRNDFPQKNYLTYLAIYQLKNSKVVAETYPLALHVGMDFHEKRIEEMRESVEYAPKALPAGNEYVHCGDLDCKLRNVCTVKEISKETHSACVCAKTGKMFGFCEECGEYEEELTSVYNERGREIFVCPECLENYYYKCEDCGDYFHEDTMTAITEISYVCESCLEGYYFCEHCGGWYEEQDIVSISDGDTYVCRECAERHYHKCDHCGEYFKTEDMVYDNAYPGTQVCMSCYEDHYEFCERCNCLINREEDNGIFTDYGYVCSSCAPCGGKVKDYGYKPKPAFHKSANDPEKGNLYFGIELEFSHPDFDVMETSLEHSISCLNNGEEEADYYFKSDGSLENGFETVSHPRTLSAWLEERDRIKKWFWGLEDNVLEGRDGLHIHISRKSMTVPHMIRFSSFMACYAEQAKIIARRNSTYSTYREKPHNGREVQGLLRNRSRYEAVNWENSNTVELRIFRNTTSVVTFYACLEFTHALYQFTKNHTSLLEILKGKAWIEFLKFLKTDERYSDLREFLSLSFENDAEHEEEYNILNKKKPDLSLVKYCFKSA